MEKQLEMKVVILFHYQVMEQFLLLVLIIMMEMVIIQGMYEYTNGMVLIGFKELLTLMEKQLEITVVDLFRFQVMEQNLLLVLQ